MMTQTSPALPHSRLLFAAARGARIERFMPDLTWQDWTHSSIPLRTDRKSYRVHPEDLHLEYGPVSTELRDAANTEIDWLQDSLTEYGQAVVNDYTGDVELGYAWHTASEVSQLHKQLFLLFLAEVVADKGL